MHDAGVGRHHLEIAERGLSPAQERIALAVALELDAVVVGQRARGAVLVHLHRVVDDQLGGRQRIDVLGIAAEAHDRLAHRRQVDDAGHAGEVLHDDARRREGDLVRRGCLRVPVEQRLDVGARDVDAVLEAQQILEQDLQRVGEARELVLRQCRQAPDLVSTVPCGQCRARLEAVGHACLRCEPFIISEGPARGAARRFFRRRRCGRGR